jgi:hypothetical protein
MIAIIIDKHAHRLMQDGTVQSVELVELLASENAEAKVVGECINRDGWDVVNPEKDLEIPSGDFYLIQKYLEILHSMFPSDRPKLPKSEEQPNVAKEMNTPRV